MLQNDQDNELHVRYILPTLQLLKQFFLSASKMHMSLSATPHVEVLDYELVNPLCSPPSLLSESQHSREPADQRQTWKGRH